MAQSSQSSAPIGPYGPSHESRQLCPSPYLIMEKSKHRWSGCLGVFTPAALDPQMCAFRPSGCMQNDITLTAHAVALHGECFRLHQEITLLFHAAHPSDLSSTCSSFTQWTESASEAGPDSTSRSCFCVAAHWWRTSSAVSAPSSDHPGL